MSERVLIRGGHRRLLVWRPAAPGPAVSTAAFLPAEPYDRADYAAYTDGARRPDTRERGAELVVSDRAARAALRAWAAAGADVAVLLVGYDSHWQCEEPLPCLVEPVAAPFGRLAGERLRLATSAVDARVYDDEDLLAPAHAAPWAGAYARTLPAPGLTVHAYVPGFTATTTLEALSATGAVLAASGPADAPSLALPEGTWAVRVAAAASPALVTRPPAALPTYAALVDADGAALVDADGAALLG